MPKMRKNKTKIKDKDNVIPFNKPKVDKKAEEEATLRQSEQDRINFYLGEKFKEIEKIFNVAQIENRWCMYALIFHAKQTSAFALHPSEYKILDDITTKEIVKNQREYLQERFPEFVSEDSEESTKKVLH
tara:strand:+ start:748 stop:1137 length:390 start_codon:yes stop_codon:yes gene_type:complete